MELISSEIYPGSISYSNVTDESNLIKWVEEEYEIMPNKGFTIREFLVWKMLTSEK